MADVHIKVDTSILQTAASEIAGLTKTLQGDFDELQSCVRQTSRYWVGAAGDQYRGEFDAEKKEASQLLALLAGYPADLLAIEGIYDGAESENERSSGALPSNIL